MNPLKAAILIRLGGLVLGWVGVDPYDKPFKPKAYNRRAFIPLQNMRIPWS